MGPLLKPVQVPLDGILSLSYVNRNTQISLVSLGVFFPVPVYSGYRTTFKDTGQFQNLPKFYKNLEEISSRFFCNNKLHPWVPECFVVFCQ